MRHDHHNFIMKFSKTALYKWVYNHPKASIAILTLFFILILYIFVSFVMQNIVIPAFK